MPHYDPEALARTLCDLLAIRSLSGEEKEAADYVERCLKSAGLATVRDGDDNVVAFVEPRQAGEPRQNTLHLSGHLDTVVPATDWPGDPFNPRIEGAGDDRRVVGLGATDMKSGLAVMLHLARHFASERLQRLRLGVLFTVCEERSAHGKRNGVHRVLAQHPGRWALTTEASCDPAGIALELGCQGHAHVALELRGRAAHSASPEIGLNAIHAAARVVERVERSHAAYKEAPVFENLCARASAAVTRIEGGRASNIIPDRCTLHVSRRTVPGETLEDVRREAAVWTRGLDGVEAAATIGGDAPACVVDANGPFLRAAQEASHRLFGHVHYAWNRARTDLVLFKQAGMDVLNIGPGFMSQAHVAGEFVRIADLPRAAALIEATCRGLDAYLAS